MEFEIEPGRSLEEDYPQDREIQALDLLKVLLEWRLPRQTEKHLKLDILAI